METQEQRLTAYLEHARDLYAVDAVRALEAAAAATDARVASMSEQQRATYQDTYDLLSSAVAEKFPADDGDGDCDYWGYLVDFTDEWAVFCQKGQKFQVPYTLDGESIELGDAVPVREQTTYVPMESNSAITPNEARKTAGLPEVKDPKAHMVPVNAATPKRAFSSLVEQPPAHAGEFQVRMDSGEADPVASFLGYASTTGVPYSVRDWLGEYEETIMPGAFAKTLREQGDIPLLFNHDGVPLASTGSGTSRLSEDKVGLRNEADLDRRDALTNSICVQLSRGVLSKMSFSFRAVKDAWNDLYDERGVTEAALYDSSIVTYPANPSTSGELVEEMRSALGREGRSLWLAEHELSVRSALPALSQRGQVPDDAEDLLERALRALVHADEVVCRSRGPHGRARTFLVAGAMLELRSGKVLSQSNQELLSTALSALSEADDHHGQARDAVQSVVDSAVSADGQDSNQDADSTDSLAVGDGAGSRSVSPQALARKREREQEIRELRRGRTG